MTDKAPSTTGADAASAAKTKSKGKSFTGTAGARSSSLVDLEAGVRTTSSRAKNNTGADRGPPRTQYASVLSEENVSRLPDRGHSVLSGAGRAFSQNFAALSAVLEQGNHDEDNDVDGNGFPNTTSRLTGRETEQRTPLAGGSFGLGLAPSGLSPRDGSSATSPRGVQEEDDLVRANASDAISATALLSRSHGKSAVVTARGGDDGGLFRANASQATPSAAASIGGEGYAFGALPGGIGSTTSFQYYAAGPEHVELEVSEDKLNETIADFDYGRTRKTESEAAPTPQQQGTRLHDADDTPAAAVDAKTSAAEAALLGMMRMYSQHDSRPVGVAPDADASESEAKGDAGVFNLNGVIHI